jgi:hypothetical protein
MTTLAIRDKLYDYIRVADDKKIKAIFMMLEDDIEHRTEWWKDKGFVNDLDTNYEAWKNGKAKGHSRDDINVAIEKLKSKRNKK